MIVRLLIGIGVGACIGAVMGYFGKCSSGTCPLTASPYQGAVFGGILGAVFAVVLAGTVKNAGEAPRIEGNTPTNNKPASPSSESRRQDALAHVSNTEDFNRYVLNAAKPCLADFYSDHCGPCRMLASTMEQLATEYDGRAVVCKVNLDSAPGLAGPYDITAIPAVLFFDGGKEVHRLIGLRTRSDYRTILDGLIRKER